MRKTVKRIITLVLVLTLMMSTAACKGGGSSQAGPYDEQKILITGLQDGEYEITVGELKKLPQVTERAQATRSNGDTVKVKATGVLLEDVLKQKGKSIKDYSVIRFTASDGYSIAVPPDVFNNRSIILAYEIDDKAPDADTQPVRVVIPGERAMYWVRMLQRINLETGTEQVPIKKVVFLDTAVTKLPQEDYRDLDDVDKAVKTKDLVAAYAGTDKVKNVYIKASDGLYKNETLANFTGAYLEITGKEAPKFTSPNLPEGMHIRDVLYLNYGSTSFIDYAEAKKVLAPNTADGQTGIALSDVIKQTGLSRADRYKFSGLDGQSLELAADELGSGLIYENDKGLVSFRCPGAANKVVENLVSIECL